MPQTNFVTSLHELVRNAYAKVIFGLKGMTLARPKREAASYSNRKSLKS